MHVQCNCFELILISHEADYIKIVLEIFFKVQPTLLHQKIIFQMISKRGQDEGGPLEINSVGFVAVRLVLPSNKPHPVKGLSHEPDLTQVEYTFSIIRIQQSGHIWSAFPAIIRNFTSV